jgi:hypothetical protein
MDRTVRHIVRMSADDPRREDYAIGTKVEIKGRKGWFRVIAHITDGIELESYVKHQLRKKRSETKSKKQRFLRY